MRLGIPKETHPLECRVATTPSVVKKLLKKGFVINIEAGAGEKASFGDEDYTEAGATVVVGTKELYDNSDVILKIQPPGQRDDLDVVHEADLLREDHVLITILQPGSNKELLEKLTSVKTTSFALDCVPRITRAQKMDVLSSMANIAGYRAVVEAAKAYGGFFSGQMTAAGKSPPAKVLIIGAGVAGLAAIGAARSMGAIVRAFDVRPAVKEQVQSMGADFLEVELDESGAGEGGYAKTMSKEFIEAEMALFREQAKEIDIVITTALIPGRKAPILWTKRMLEIMKPGSVVVDLAASNGGNCEVCEADKMVTFSGVSVIGYTDLPSRMAKVSSEFFATNLYHLLVELGGAEGWNIDLENEVLRGSIVHHKGEVLWPAPRKPAPPAPEPQAAPEPEPEPQRVAHRSESASGGGAKWIALVLAVIFLSIGWYTDGNFVNRFSIFVLACFVGYQVVWDVTPALHTPLMSVTNAISGIIIIGGMLQLLGFGGSDQKLHLAAVLGAVAILIAAINVAGGFYVTQRMLAMFRRDK